MGQTVRTAFSVLLFLLAGPMLVHLNPAQPAAAQTAKSKAAAKKQAPPPPPAVQYDLERLPAPVRDMREAILDAVRSGRIEELRTAYELNELKPDLGTKDAGDPVAHWKQISGDGEGREILAALAEVLEAGYVILPLGRDPENTRVFVWPYFAEVPLAGLTPAQEVELLRLVPPAAVKDMKTKGKYAHWRVMIGADGTWHSFLKPN